MFSIHFADDWIRTVDLWIRKRPLCQLSYNPFPSSTKLFHPQKTTLKAVRKWMDLPTATLFKSLGNEQFIKFWLARKRSVAQPVYESILCSMVSGISMRLRVSSPGTPPGPPNNIIYFARISDCMCRGRLLKKCLLLFFDVVRNVS